MNERLSSLIISKNFISAVEGTVEIIDYVPVYHHCELAAARSCVLILGPRLANSSLSEATLIAMAPALGKRKGRKALAG